MIEALSLQLDGFTYADLYAAERLPRLDAEFARFLIARDADLAARYADYRADATLGPVATSELLIEVARHLEDFLVGAFQVGAARDRLRAAQRREAPVAAFKEQFVKRHAKRRPAHADILSFSEIHARLSALLPASDDAEFAVARAWAHAAETRCQATLALLADWVAAALYTPAGRAATRGWMSLKLPRKIDHMKLVAVEPVPDDPCGRVRGPSADARRRDGFALTDTRANLRQAMDQVHYCVYCHKHDGDFCAKGFREKETGNYRVNPLGVELTGCPLGEKISEAHLLKLEGYGLGALAMIMLDNPLVPATGHRICNDCMKACIYQKQEPVDIPQIETRILTDVLEWPWGYEIYYLLTRWNPLNRAHPYALPHGGRRVLCVGAGPAGFNLAYHLLQQGVAVAIVDGLRIEPLPARLTGAEGQTPAPIRDIAALRESLDDRVTAGFGGVAEYGITVRWDKNFLKLVHLTLARNPLFRVYGGIRFGGTLTLDDAWELGFDHVALATGAGKPTVVSVVNNLAQGMRQANDFLMALQLTGAAKRASLANLQVRLPLVVIGGGLTAIDTATEAQAYYVRQVEKTLARVEALAAAGVDPGFTSIEREVLDEHLAHGREVRAERERAAAAGEAPDFTQLLRRWGGVTVVYRRALQDSPAYLRNHEEIEKALQEGIYYREALNPTEALLDEHGRVRGMLFRRQQRGSDGGWSDAGDDDVVHLPARTVLVAAGSQPNTVYEREHPGTFAMQGRYYATHTLVDGRLEPAPHAGHCKDSGIGFFTSYAHDGRHVSVLGDNHPQFHGSVVKAMASGKHAAHAIAQALATLPVTDPRPWPAFAALLDDRLSARVTAVERVSERLVRVTVRAPQATRNWKPGQVFRLQNYESRAPRVHGTLLQMEGMAVDGVHVDAARGEVKLLLNEVGASSRIAARLAVGEPVILMGPTGTGLPQPRDQVITVIGNHSALTSAIDGAAVWRAAANRLVFIGHFADRDKALPAQALIEILTDQAIWVLDRGPALECRRHQDTCFTGGMDEFLAACQRADASYAEWLHATDQLVLSDRPPAMESVAYALRTYLKRFVKSGLRATVAVNSPMQCMMKEVCAQCLCRHHDPASGAAIRVVFSCFDQHQPMFEVDFVNLRARQRQNHVQERLANLWLSYISDAGPLSASTTGDAR